MALLASENTIKSWYSTESRVYKNFAYLFINPLWIKRVPRGFSVCPFFWMAAFSLLFLRPAIWGYLNVFKPTKESIKNFVIKPILTSAWKFGLKPVDDFFKKKIDAPERGCEGIGLLILLGIIVLVPTLCGIFIFTLKLYREIANEPFCFSIWWSAISLAITSISISIYKRFHKNDNKPCNVSVYYWVWLIGALGLFYVKIPNVYPEVFHLMVEVFHLMVGAWLAIINFSKDVCISIYQDSLIPFGLWIKECGTYLCVGLFNISKFLLIQSIHGIWMFLSCVWVWVFVVSFTAIGLLLNWIVDKLPNSEASLKSRIATAEDVRQMFMDMIDDLENPRQETYRALNKLNFDDIKCKVYIQLSSTFMKEYFNSKVTFSKKCKFPDMSVIKGYRESYSIDKEMRFNATIDSIANRTGITKTTKKKLLDFRYSYSYTDDFKEWIVQRISSMDKTTKQKLDLEVKKIQTERKIAKEQIELKAKKAENSILRKACKNTTTFIGSCVKAVWNFILFLGKVLWFVPSKLIIIVRATFRGIGHILVAIWVLVKSWKQGACPYYYFETKDNQPK